METVVTIKGQVVIPAKLRHRLGIGKGTRLAVKERDGAIVLQPLTHEYFERMAGILKTGGKLTRALLEERARDKEREEAKLSR